MSSDPEIQKPKISRIVFLVVIGLVLIAAAAYPDIKSSRVHTLVRRAEKSAAAGDFTNALQSITLALQMSPADIDALRLGARVCEKQGSADALNYYADLSAHPLRTTEDLQDYMELALARDRVGLASQVLRQLVALRPNSRTFYLASRFWLRQGQLIRATECARRSISEEPVFNRASFLLGTLLVRSRSSNDVISGKRILFAEARTNAPVRAEALRSLIFGVNLTPAEARDVKLALGTQAAGVQGFLMQQELAIRINPAEESKIVEESYRRLANSSPVDKATLAVWLCNHQGYSQVLGLSKTPEDRANLELTLSTLEAYNKTSRFKEGYQFLSDTNVIIPSMRREAVLGFFANSSGQPALAKKHADNALTLAGDDAEQLIAFADAAEEVELFDQSLRALERVSVNPALARSLAARRLQVARRAGDSRALRKIVEQQLQSDPYNTGLQNYFCYLNLLTGEDVKASTARVEKLFRENPSDRDFRICLALAKIRAGDFRGAGEVCNFDAAAAEALSDGAKAVYAAVLLSQKNDAAAREIVRRLDATQLVPEEAALIAQLLPAVGKKA